MIVEIKVPSPGESITEVEIGTWLVEDGDVVHKDQEIAEVESDKATLTIVASEAGKISIKSPEGEAVEVGSVVCTIDTSFQPEPETEVGADDTTESVQEEKIVEKPEEKPAVSEKAPEIKEQKEYSQVKVTPVARELMQEHGISVDDIIKGLKRIGKKEVETVIKGAAAGIPDMVTAQPAEMSREEDRQRMSLLRRRLSERLVSVKNETAMLTTFNEIDMTNLMELRKKNQQQFIETHGYKLGFMSFFAKASVVAAGYFPALNSQLDGEEIVSPRFVDIGIAVSTPRGLMVPVVRNAESKTIPQIELEIKELAEKARDRKISVEELTGGTFTITNGGIFGSLLSTPILNPPQSAILGMHKIMERPVAVNGQVVIRPMMYVALSYDHRIIDGKDSVSFLVKVKELIENPELLLTGGKEPGKMLLGI